MNDYEIFLDIESDGLLSPSIDRIPEIIQGAIVVRKISTGEIVDWSSEIINTVFFDFDNITDEQYSAMAVTGLTPERMKKNSVNYEDSNFKKILEKYNKINNYYIAHNAIFDIGILRFDKDFFCNAKVIDTLPVARSIFRKDLKKFALQFFRYRYKFYLTENEYISNVTNKIESKIKAHDALGDVITLMQLFDLCKEKNTKKNQYDYFVELSNSLFCETTINFTKESGNNWSDVSIGLVEWIERTIPFEERPTTVLTAKIINEIYEHAFQRNIMITNNDMQYFLESYIDNNLENIKEKFTLFKKILIKIKYEYDLRYKENTLPWVFNNKGIEDNKFYLKIKNKRNNIS
jgi:DNA polymerase III epsilon subunit-like protein